ncbi:hypothetical protein M569_14724, partial [Genlisea aurea]
LKASDDSRACLRYYKRQDIPRVLQFLYSKTNHTVAYAEICRGILHYWELPDEILPCYEMSNISIQLENCKGGDSSTAHSDNMLGQFPPFLDNENKVHQNLNGNPFDCCVYTGVSFKATGYLNNFLHGGFAASAAANLAILSSEENQVPDSRTSSNRRNAMSDNVALQVKAFSSGTMRFFWPNSEKRLSEVPRERCSWCFYCKATVASKKGCLLNAAASNSIKGAMKSLSAVRSSNLRDGRLADISMYILFMEKSLSGLVVGPFLYEIFRKRWRKQVEHAATFSELQTLLLELEESIRTIAFSGDWIKPFGGSSTRSSICQVAENSSVQVQKHKPGRRGRKPSCLVEVAGDDSQDKSADCITWWRGDTLSKLLFQRGILPSPVTRKAALQ